MEILGNSDGTWPRTASIFAVLGILVSVALLLASCGGSPSQPNPISQPRQLTALAVQPASADAVAPNGTFPFTANGTFNQAPTTQDDPKAVWASSDSLVATIDPGTGLATCIAAGGPVTVTASDSGMGGTVQGSGTLICQSSPPPPPPPPSKNGVCLAKDGPTILTGGCLGTKNGICPVSASDPVNCPAGAPVKNLQLILPCALPPLTFVDGATSCTP